MAMGTAKRRSGLARENLRRLGDLDRFVAIVSECGSCSGHLKEYAEVLADDPVWLQKAVLLRDKTRSFSEFVIERGGLEYLVGSGPGEVATPADAAAVAAAPPAATAARPPRRPAGLRLPRPSSPTTIPATWDAATRMWSAQPRQILESLPGVVFREAAESDSCCGAAGTYGVLHPETSAAIIERKMGFIRDTGATILATECPSCMMQLAFGAQRAGLDAEVLNVSQLCDRVGRSSER